MEPIMTHSEFTRILKSLGGLSPEQMQQLRRELDSKLAPPPAASQPDTDPILGLMRDDAELMDEIVSDAYRHRWEETWRELDL
jgi:hypothetical protein